MTCQIRPARDTDAQVYLRFLRQVATETDFLAFDEQELALTPGQMALVLQAIDENPQQLLLLAFKHQRLVGALWLVGHSEHGLAHIAEVGVAVLKRQWQQGIGTSLFERAFEWVVAGQTFVRLELTVQQRNQPAITLYQKLGFQTEAILKWGLFDRKDGLIDALQMVKLIVKNVSRRDLD